LVELITIWTGKPPGPPGNGGRLKANALIPSILLNSACTSGLSLIDERLRSSHGVSSMPAMPFCGPLMPLRTNRKSVSGNLANSLSSFSP
jgi:hypothetical protein